MDYGGAERFAQLRATDVLIPWSSGVNFRLLIDNTVKVLEKN